MNFDKTFYYTDVMVKRSRMYGSQVRECGIYRIRENDGAMIKIGDTTYNTGSTCGSQNEVFQWLREHNYIDNKFTGTYFYDSGAYEEYKIYSII